MSEALTAWTPDAVKDVITHAAMVLIVGTILLVFALSMMRD